MPEKDVSLKRTILRHFAGRKKKLSDETIARQKCTRCDKTGHTKGGCPDQTQAANKDQTEKDYWVRKLIQMPRVRIAEVNRGLSLEEGVKLWLQRERKRTKEIPGRSHKREKTH